MSELGTSERPATFEAAFAADTTGAESLPASTEPTNEPASATVTPEAPITPTPGEPPQERWPDILNNAREKTRAEVEAEWQQYAWAKSIPRDQYEALARWYQHAQTNPLEFALGMVDDLSADPTHQQALRSQAARLLRAARVQQQPDAEIQPDIPVMDAQGQVVNRTYSAEAVQKIVQQAIAKALGPVQEDLKTRQQREQAEAQQKAKAEFVQRESSRLRSTVEGLPHAKEHWNAILEAAEKLPTDLSAGEALYQAYVQVVVPTLRATEQSKALDTLQRQAAASTVNPAAAVVPASRKVTSFNDASLKWD